MALSGSSYWCYRCNSFTGARVLPQDDLHCPDCGGGFVEEIESHSRSPPRSPADTVLYSGSAANSDRSPRFRRRRRGGGDPSPFNPVIVLRRAAEAVGGWNEGDRGNYELYYEEDAGSGLQPLPSSISQFLMGSGFDRLLDQLGQIEINGLGRLEHPPASKAAVESMPLVKILPAHVAAESHCAVCKDVFEINSEAREMPCKHIYHSDCIFPWLAIRNSCPVCRHELPSDDSPESESGGGGGEEDTVGLTIWRLPYGGFAVGRFSGGRRAAESELPVVYTEMDGGFDAVGAPRRITWAPSGRRSRESNGIGGAFRSFMSFFRRVGSSSSSSSRSRSEPGAVRTRRSITFGISSRRRRN